jgi:hypothetical protein
MAGICLLLESAVLEITLACGKLIGIEVQVGSVAYKKVV